MLLHAIDPMVALPGRWWYGENGGPPAVVNVLTPHRFGGERKSPLYNECFVEVSPAG